MSEVLVTEKSLSDLEILAVKSPGNNTIHVMKVEDHRGWSQGERGKTICGRYIDAMYILEDITQEDRPCKLCERTMPVVAIMFETTEALQRMIEVAEEQNEIMSKMSWISHGVHFGYISPPYCQAHNPVPLTTEEHSEREEGEDPCVYVVRLYHGQDLMEFPDGEVS